MMRTGPTTISKVIAFELGLLIAVLTWIAFAGVPGMKPRAAEETKEPAETSFANVSQNSRPKQPRRAPVNYPADDLQVAQSPAQYPVATVQTYDPGLAAGDYGDTADASGQSDYGYEQPGVEGYIVNQDPADTIGIFPDPVLDSPDCYYSPYDQFYGYAQPSQIVILNTNRSFAPRNRMARRGPGRVTMGAPNRNGRTIPPVQGGRGTMRPGPVAKGRSPRPPRVNTGTGNSAPRRSVSVQRTRPGQASHARSNP